MDTVISRAFFRAGICCSLSTTQAPTDLPLRRLRLPESQTAWRAARD